MMPKPLWTRVLPKVVWALLALFFLLLAFPYLRRGYLVIELSLDEPPGQLPIPVEGVSPDHLVDTWGASRGDARRHQGIDIFAPRETPVHSTTRGLIVARDTGERGGNYLYILGPGGYRHYYAHLERYSRIQVGDWVGRGELIGYVGNSGNARGTPPHLHYGIYKFPGGAINPYPFLIPEPKER